MMNKSRKHCPDKLTLLLEDAVRHIIVSLSQTRQVFLKGQIPGENMSKTSLNELQDDMLSSAHLIPREGKRTKTGQ